MGKGIFAAQDQNREVLNFKTSLKLDGDSNLIFKPQHDML
jgi:hypothetical protein